MPMRGDREPRLTQGDHGSGGGFVRLDRRTYVLRRVLLVTVLLLLAFTVTRTCQSLAASGDPESRDAATKDENAGGSRNAPKKDASNDPGDGTLANIAPKSPLDPPDAPEKEDRTDDDRGDQEARGGGDESDKEEAELATAKPPEKETVDIEAVRASAEKISPEFRATASKPEPRVKSIATRPNETPKTSRRVLASTENTTSYGQLSSGDSEAVTSDVSPVAVEERNAGGQDVARRRSFGGADTSVVSAADTTGAAGTANVRPEPVRPKLVQPAQVEEAAQVEAAQVEAAQVEAVPKPEPVQSISPVSEPAPIVEEAAPVVPAVDKRARGASVRIAGGRVEVATEMAKVSVGKGPTVQVGGKVGKIKVGKGNRLENNKRNGILAVPGVVVATPVVATPVTVAP